MTKWAQSHLTEYALYGHIREMTLAEFFKTSGMTYEQFAEAVDASRSAVGKWARFERTPRPRQMLRIETATGGQVTPSDLISPAPKVAETAS